MHESVQHAHGAAERVVQRVGYADDVVLRLQYSISVRIVTHPLVVPGPDALEVGVVQKRVMSERRGLGEASRALLFRCVS